MNNSHITIYFVFVRGCRLKFMRKLCQKNFVKDRLLGGGRGRLGTGKSELQIPNPIWGKLSGPAIELRTMPKEGNVLPTIILVFIIRRISGLLNLQENEQDQKRSLGYFAKGKVWPAWDSNPRKNRLSMVPFPRG